MDRSLGTPAQPRIQDVTDQILKSHTIYGSSDYTNPAYSSSNRSLNYAVGGSIHRPELERVTIIPYTLKYQDSVGLFGKENHFVRVDVGINTEIAFACFDEPGWECAALLPVNEGTVNTYEELDIDRDADLTTINTYEPPKVTANSVSNKFDGWVSIDLKNLKTGNKYIDSWLDVRLYRKDREEHAYDTMYVRLNDFFYIGFHARNTKRLPYNVECVIGREFIGGSEVDDRYKNQ